MFVFRDKTLQRESFFGVLADYCTRKTILPPLSFIPSNKNSLKNLDSHCFLTSLLILSLKNDVNIPSKSNKQTNFEKK
jgi:hypothetical protein